MKFSFGDSEDPSIRIRLERIRQLEFSKIYFRQTSQYLYRSFVASFNLGKRLSLYLTRTWRISLASLIIVTNNPATFAPDNIEPLSRSTANLVEINIDQYLAQELSSEDSQELTGFLVKPTITQTKKTGSKKLSPKRPFATSINLYPYGYCTWWVKERRPDIPNFFGHAKYWLGAAERVDYQTGMEARIGAIIVTDESPFGHVGYVELVQGNILTISDMNLEGWGKVTTRTLSASSPIIRGYIY